MVQGTCLCGALRYSIDGPFSAMMNCHCSMCRKQHGAAFATYVVAPLEGFRWIAGEDQVVRYRSSEHGSRAFCGRCGSVAPGAIPKMGIVLAPAGNLRGDLGIKPQRHLFVGSKAPWHAIADALPQHEAHPPGFATEGVARPAVVPREGVTEGACLCGEVAYEISGTPSRMLNCHCSRCQLGRSAAHASNAFCRIDQFRWTRGEGLVREFKVPEAKFHTTAFCSRCGSKVPRISAERGIVVVPAGSLDTDPGIRPMAHIFVADKAPWFDIADTLPQFPAMPPAPG
jgi:hypothetical protein